MDRCIACLESHSWQLDAAVQAALGHDDHAPAAGLGGGRGGGRGGHGARRAGDQAVQHDSDDGGEGPEHKGWFHRATGVPFASAASLGLLGPEPRRPGTESQRFLDKFELDHGPIHPRPQLGTFREAVDVAKREFKFLVVYLHSPHHQDTPAFARDVLCSEVMAEFVDDNFVFWMGSVLDPEAYGVAALLRASAFPFLATVATTVDNSTTVCDVHEGAAPRDGLMNWLLNIMETQGPQLVVQRAEAEVRPAPRPQPRRRP